MHVSFIACMRRSIVHFHCILSKRNTPPARMQRFSPKIFYCATLSQGGRTANTVCMERCMLGSGLLSDESLMTKFTPVVNVVVLRLQFRNSFGLAEYALPR